MQYSRPDLTSVEHKGIITGHTPPNAAPSNESTLSALQWVGIQRNPEVSFSRAATKSYHYSSLIIS